MDTPKTLIEAVRFFSDFDNCKDSSSATSCRRAIFIGNG